MDWNERIASTTGSVQQSLNVNRLVETQKAKLTTPYLSNVSHDPMIDGRVVHFLKSGKTQLGAAQGPGMTIFLSFFLSFSS